MYEIGRTVAVIHAFDLCDWQPSYPDLPLLCTSTWGRLCTSRFVLRFCILCLHHLKCSHNWLCTLGYFLVPVLTGCIDMRNFFLLQTQCDAAAIPDYSVPRQLNICLYMWALLNSYTGKTASAVWTQLTNWYTALPYKSHPAQSIEATTDVSQCFSRDTEKWKTGWEK